MPPKKKAKKAAQPASSMAELPGLLLSTKKTLEQLWEMRHGHENDGATHNAAPFLWGGHFKAIAQRAWSQPAELLGKSHAMLVGAGMMENGSTLDQFVNNHVRLTVFWISFNL